MSVKVDHVILKDQNLARVSLGGVLENDEKALAELSIPATLDLHLHLEQLRGINSLGVRAFVNWSSKLKNPKIMIHDAPKAFVDQINMVDGFLPAQARMRSFYVPYYSEATGEETQVQFTIGINFYLYEGQWKFFFPEVHDSRGNLMSVDVQPERYFRFLNKMK
ncbi:hypothetical protein AB1A81_12370 [Bdellovibrio bacteriovorus]|uniref:Uncharacterized protein n=1 Tax=Bdellovibrio bacteriovorus (strain ATCC 15356 / DSM 50701 / NCIMB 9529 / HD100) TaxID=264462 RepID=Q6MJS3_BDEBA|nr:hypothetical protein [Bdellovibrio bacteriovorus]CAE80487.1 hypothetical protein predicted by Glimmer/Critica [Bdellovibrio bacteriovorus HD100]